MPALMWVDKGGTPLWGRHIGECRLVECTFTITSLAWWCRPPAVVTTRSGRAAGVPALEMIRAMLLSSDRVEHRGAGTARLSTEPGVIHRGRLKYAQKR
ncbi:hypothetical protein HZB03_01050 [Candidatus Woesearchaeota archaeon]|nr:hypothetical protein [Candidatus Woesearchaeota archaeon]